MEVKELLQAKGMNKVAAQEIVDLIGTWENLVSRDPKKLAAGVGISIETAKKVIELASEKVIASTETEEGVDLSKIEEEVHTVLTKKAPEGTIATKKSMRPTGKLAKQLGIEVKPYIGCSHCRIDLEIYIEENPGMVLKEMEFCPNCDATFISQMVSRCYACGATMNDAGKCLRCGAQKTDEELLKAVTIFVHRDSSRSGKSALREARSIIKEEPTEAIRILAKAQAENWIADAERQQPASSSYPPSSSGPSERFGDPFYK